MAEFIGTTEAGRILGLTRRSVSRLCNEGRIEGAIQVFKRRDWLIPTPVVYLDRRGRGRPPASPAPGPEGSDDAE